MKFLIHIFTSVLNTMCVYVCILPLNIYTYKGWNLYILNRFKRLRTWLIPFHAIWGLCWYNVCIYIYVYFALPVNLETSSNVANHQSCISTNWYGPFSSPGRQPTTPVKKSWRDIKRHKKTQKHGTYLGVPDRLELLWKVNDVNDE